MIDAEIFKTILLVLLGICLLSLIFAVFKRETDNIRRAIIFAVILGGMYFFVQQSGIQKLSIQTIRDRYFPLKLEDFQYYKTEAIEIGVPTTRYFFTGDNRPPLRLSMSSDGSTLNITDVSLLNRILEHIGLEKVLSGVPQLSSITGKTNDVDFYRWDNYPGGTLIVERVFYQDKTSMNTKASINTITVKGRR